MGVLVDVCMQRSKHERDSAKVMYMYRYLVKIKYKRGTPKLANEDPQICVKKRKQEMNTKNCIFIFKDVGSEETTTLKKQGPYSHMLEYKKQKTLQSCPC